MGQQIWTWEAIQFENIESESVRTEAAASSWNVALGAPNRAWGYCISLPPEARAFIMWRARLQVLRVQGNILPGLAYLNGIEGFSFQLDTAARCVELRYVLPSSETLRIALFDMQKIAAPFDLILELNVITRACKGIVDGKKTFEFPLPLENLPAFDAVSDVEILTTTPPKKGGGTVSYGKLTLHCE